MENIIENNKLIADFLGFQKTDIGMYDSEGILKLSYTKDNVFDELLFHTSFDWLMPVIKQIGDKTGFELIMNYSESYWNNAGENPFDESFDGYEKVEGVYKAVVSFINWYNEQTK